MNAVLSIDNMTTTLMTLDEAVKVAEILKNAMYLRSTYAGGKYEVKEKPVRIELELVTEAEVSQWLS